MQTMKANGTNNGKYIRYNCLLIKMTFKIVYMNYFDVHLRL